jgi:hypothetical protein
MLDAPTKTVKQYDRHRQLDKAARTALTVLESVDRALKGGMCWSTWQTWRIQTITELREALDVEEPEQADYWKTEP